MWFTENAWPPMIIAGILAVMFLVLWNGNRRGQYLVLAFLCALSIAVFFLLERSIVTEGERLQQLVVHLCEDFRDKKPGVDDYVSDKHPEIKLMFSAAQALVTIHSDMRLSDFQSSVSGAGDQGTVHFRANATIDVAGHGNVGYRPARLIITFNREKDGWKIVDLKRLHPINGKEIQLLDQSAG